MKKGEIFSPILYSKKLLETYQIKCDMKYTLWLYNPDTGLWCNNADKLIEQILREQYLKEKHLSNYHVKEIISHIKSVAFENKNFPSPLWHLIPFNNCVYDIKNEVYRDYLSTDFLTSKLTVNYGASSNECPLIDKIFRQCVKPEDLDELYELVAYCMVSSYANQEFFFILGSGRNGKSVYTNIITRLLGIENISAVSLHGLQTNRFAGAELYGKFANICTELQYTDLNNTDIIKKLTGGDLILAERKFMNSFYFSNYAKLIFVTNELPKTKDKTPAFYRRARIINFPFSFEGEREDKFLLEKITVQELEGLASKCVWILQQMIVRNFTFSKQKTTLESEQQYEKISNPIDTFIEENCQRGANAFVSKDEFKERLDEWMRVNGIRIRTDKDIIQYMRERGIEEQKRTLTNGKRKNTWIGIAWKK
jgi:putative DNA primase/helicase